MYKSSAEVHARVPALKVVGYLGIKLPLIFDEIQRQFAESFP